MAVSLTDDRMSSPVGSGSTVQSAGSAEQRAFTDVDEQAAWVCDAFPQRYDQLGSGPFAGDMTRVDLDGVLVLRERVNCTVFQAGTSRTVSLGWPINPSRRYRCNGVDLDPQHVMMWGCNDEFEILTDPSELCAVTVSLEAFADWNGCAPDARHAVPHGVRIVPNDLADALHSIVFKALERAEPGAVRHGPAFGPDVLRDDLLQVFMAVAELPLPAPGRPRLCERTYERVVRAAREEMAADAGEALSIQELCSRVGVSRRNLHYAFRTMLGMPPAQYLRCVRLNAARRALKKHGVADGTVADVAWRWGFGHPSHFAADYKRRFGELPSETARRACAEPADIEA